MRTIAGLGSWEGWINSVEMDNAIKFKYQFEILKGYQFEKGDIFSSYVNKLYDLRLEYETGTPMNLVAKLLLNSLYGKFGMKMESTRVDIYNVGDKAGLDYFNSMVDAFGETVHDYVKVDNYYVIIRDALLDVKYNKELDMYHGQDINIAIASAITAGARVFKHLILI